MKSSTHRQPAAATPSRLLAPFPCHSGRSRALSFRLITAGLSFFLAASVLRAAGITVAAASDLKFALPEVAAKYEEQTGNQVSITYGSSGNFYAQIQNGAPFDLFFSADMDYPRQLEAAGLAEPGTLYQYGVGRLVLWVPANSPVDVARRGWDALLDPAIRKIAIANPRHAPYGQAAVAALMSAGIYDQVAAKLVYGGKYFAGGAVCGVRQRRCRAPCPGPGALSAPAASRKILERSCRRASPAQAGCRRTQVFPQ